MRNSIWEARIPTLLGMMLLVIGISLSAFAVQKGTNFISRASSGTTPRDVRISNITDTSFTVSYKTDDAIEGSVLYGETESQESLALDEKDTSATQRYHIHPFTLKNLKPETKYFFAILSGDTRFQNNNQPYEVTTGRTLGKTITENTLQGKILSHNGTLLSDGIGYVSISDGQLLSFRITNGDYSLPLETLRTADLESYFPLRKETVIPILFVSIEGQSQVKVLSQHADAVPTVTISQDYDFTFADPLVSPVASRAGEFETFPTFKTTLTSTPTPSPLNRKNSSATPSASTIPVSPTNTPLLTQQISKPNDTRFLTFRGQFVISSILVFLPSFAGVLFFFFLRRNLYV